MRRRELIRVVALSAFLVSGRVCQSAPITVSVEPVASVVNVGDTFTVSLLADIPDPVLGWGLDVDFNPGILSHNPLTDVSIGPLWFGAFGVDPDGLAGLAFPLPISGTGILLAELTFTAVGVGVSALTAGVTPGDLTEGFALDPVGFGDLQFLPAGVTVGVGIGPPAIPEPATVALMSLGVAGAALAKRSCRRPKGRACIGSSLRGGCATDINGDRVVTLADFMALRRSFGRCQGTIGFLSDADYDGSGCITFVDYQIWYGHYVNR